MRRLIILFGVLFCGAAYAATETINWFVDGGVYATTTCESGGDITLPPTPTKYGYTFQGWTNYIRLEYIESTGTQYIDTQTYLTEKFKTEYKFFIPDVPLGHDGMVWASYDTVNNRYAINIRGGNTFLLQRHDGLLPYAQSEFKKGVSYIIEDTLNKSIINDTIHEGEFTFLQTGIPVGLFGNVDGLYLATIRMYYFKIYDGDTLVRNFIPVLDPDGTACMYDLVEQKYYYNAGTGDFIAGPVAGE